MFEHGLVGTALGRLEQVEHDLGRRAFERVVSNIHYFVQREQIHRIRRLVQTRRHKQVQLFVQRVHKQAGTKLVQVHKQSIN